MYARRRLFVKFPLLYTCLLYTSGGGILAVYLAAVYYYLFKIKWALERFSGAVQEVGTEQAKWNLSVKFARESDVYKRQLYIL